MTMPQYTDSYETWKAQGRPGGVFRAQQPQTQAPGATQPIAPAFNPPPAQNDFQQVQPTQPAASPWMMQPQPAASPWSAGPPQGGGGFGFLGNPFSPVRGPQEIAIGGKPWQGGFPGSKDLLSAALFNKWQGGL